MLMNLKFHSSVRVPELNTPVIPFKQTAKWKQAVAGPGGGGAMDHTPPPGAVKIVIKNMAAEGGDIDFMFLAPPARSLDPLVTRQHSSRTCTGTCSSRH